MEIEIEKKFLLDKKKEEQLLDEAEFVRERKLIDTYYDTKEYDLAKRDIWFRSRDGKFQCKIAVAGHESYDENFVARYQELSTEQEIRNLLKIVPIATLSEDLQTAGYVPYVTFTTTRRTYKKEGFTIDIDQVDFGYSLAEVEVVVSDGSNVQEATDRIIAFAKDNGLELLSVRGKLLEWIKRNDPKGYQSILQAWNVGDIPLRK